jgi:FkbM family methyltransferase
MVSSDHHQNGREMNLTNLFQTLTVADIARDHPVTFVDIGLRDGFQNELDPIAFAVDAIGFEPEQAAHAALVANPETRWRSVEILQQAIGACSGRQTLTLPVLPESGTLMTPDTEIGRRFRKPAYFEAVRTVEVETVLLDDALSHRPPPDYIKIDIEGPELGVLESAPKSMSRLLAARVEVAFLALRHSQPLAHDVAEFFHAQGFETMEFISPAHWRREGYVIHPYLAPEIPVYSKGQLIQGDYLFFKSPSKLADTESVIKMALISMAMGYFDHALTLLERPDVDKYLRENYQTIPLSLVQPASKRYGRKVYLNALYRQARGFCPFVRGLGNFLKG